MNKFLLILLLILSGQAHAQSAIQIKSKLAFPILIVLQNANNYFEESGSNISVLNLQPGVYTLSIFFDSSHNNKDKIIDVDLNANEKLCIDVNKYFELEKSVLILENRGALFDGRNAHGIPGKSRVMADADFAILLASMKGMFMDDNTKSSIAIAGAKYRLLKTDQVRKLLSSLSFDDNRLTLAKALFKNVIDKQNFYLLKKSFYSSFAGDDLIKFINAQ